MLLRIKIIEKLKDRFDYNEFKTLCEKEGMPLLSIGEFAQKVGMLTVAERMFPTDKLGDAYRRFISVMSREYESVETATAIGNTVNVQTNCGGCGGGQVR